MDNENTMQQSEEVVTQQSVNGSDKQGEQVQQDNSQQENSQQESSQQNNSQQEISSTIQESNQEQSIQVEKTQSESEQEMQERQQLASQSQQPLPAQQSQTLQAPPQQLPPQQSQLQQTPQQQLPAQQSQPQQTPSQPQLPPDVAAFYAGGAKELNVMLDTVSKRDELISELKSIVNDGKKLEKELADEKKNFEADMSASIEEERDKYVSEETGIITEGNASLRKTKSDRSKAKERAVKNRIESETSELIAENKSTNRFIRKTLKENGLPTYCNTKWFYTLYCTQGFLEWLIKMVVFLCGIVVIPGVVVWLADPWWFFKIILWALVIVVCAGIYITIFLLTKDKDNGTLEEMREHRDKIHDNEKKIRDIRKGIKRDADESSYNLGEFDAKIAELEKNISDATKRREEKLREFDEVKKQQVIESVNAKHNPVINAKQNSINEKTNLYQQKNDELNRLNQNIVDNYEKYLTKSYTNAGSIRKMLELINNNSAANIGQAFSMIKK